MDASTASKSPRGGFTLVELLVVIIIIGILAGLTTAAVIAAKNAAHRATIRTELTQLQMSLEKYKTEVGEYPPDFFGLKATVPHPGADPQKYADLRDTAKKVLTRHLRKRFPRYQGNWDDFHDAILTNYGLDLSELDPASALVFWLGGLPENPGDKRPAGFHADPANPCKTGLPREGVFHEFDPDQIVFASKSVFKYYYLPKLPAGIPPAPFVYFRAQRGPDNQRTYEFIERDPTDSTKYIAAVRHWEHPTDSAVELAVPYRANSGEWEAETTCQILSAGLDGAFGAHVEPGDPVSGLDATAAAPLAGYNSYPITKDGALFESGDYDNMASFGEGKLEDEL